MATEVLPMPHLGVSVTDGVVIEWHKAEGDLIRTDEVVCDVATDKVDTEVAAPFDAVLGKILVAVGETVDVGAPLAELLTDGEEPTREKPAAVAAEKAKAAADTVPATSAAPAPSVPAGVAKTAPASDGDGRILASPVARRIAAEHKLDLRTVVGSGINGRIRRSDVEAALSAPGPDQSPAASTPPPAADLPPGYEGVPHEVVATSHQRRAIAEHMTRSRKTAAHMTTEVEVDMHRVSLVRARLNERALAEGRPKLSFLPFVSRAACSALAQFPNLNASFEGKRLIRWRSINLGIAVDTERGLMAPVIRDCQELNVYGIGERIGDIADRARSGGLTADDMRGGTFTISNPGSVGAVSAMAIINQPQVAILGLPKIVKRPAVVVGPEGEELIAVRPLMLLALTFDHRALDGAEATRGAVRIKELLEGWDEGDYA
jgi:2-oxoglutarate dehydrogenase E2 component (dihydrolipoamide succinyltransferase)